MDKRIAEICDNYSKHHGFSGVCLVRRGEDPAIERAYGFAHRGFHIPNTADTLFDTASVTKVFTAAAVLLLVQEGLLALDSRIAEVIDLTGTAIPTDVTLEQLLTHASGIADDADEEAGEVYADLFIRKPNYSLRNTGDFLPQFAYKPPLFKAGTAVRYNNCAFVLLGLAIEKVAGRSYRKFVADRIFGPLGMAHTKFCAMDEVNENTAEGYFACYDGENRFTHWKKNIYSYPPVGSPDAGAYTTARDMDRFFREMKKGALLDGTHTQMLFSPHSRFTRPYTAWEPAPGAVIRNGYAFEFLEIDGDIFCMRKDGINEGVCAMASYYPGMDTTAIILGNQDCNIWQMHREIQTVLYEESPQLHKAKG